MIALQILYANREGARFDWDYYLNTHMPLSIRLHGDALKGISIQKGINTGMEGVQLAFMASTTMHFDSVESFLSAFMPHAATLQGDMPNYTNVEPVIQFSEIVLNR